MLSKVIKNNDKFSELELCKNCLTNTGIKQIARVLESKNRSIVHLSLGGNNIYTEGAIALFRALIAHPTLVSLNLANNDCYKNKIKIGAKGAEELSNMLKHPMCLISNLDLTDNALTSDAFQHVISGVRACKSLVSLNLAQNDLGQSNQAFSSLLAMLKNGENNVLQELNLSDNMLTDRHFEELAAVFRLDRRLQLTSLNLASNPKVKPYATALLFCSLSNNSSVPISRLILNNNDLEISKKSNRTAAFQLTKAIIMLLSCSRNLTHLSLANCGISKDLMLAIGEGLFKNNKL